MEREGSRCARAMCRATLGIALCGGLLVAAGRSFAQEIIFPLPASQADVAPAVVADTTVTRAGTAVMKAPFGATARALRDSLVALARAQLGRRYVLGGESPTHGFDCSGLVRYLARALSIDVPRTAAMQASVGEEVPKDTSRLRPGDLITFGKGKRASHIGIYVGDGRFIHASSAAGRVVESRLDRPPARRVKPWRGVRRILVSTDSAAAENNAS